MASPTARTILSVAYPFARVGPQAVGGAEVVLTTLERELAREGFRSLVLAAEGSEVAGELIPVPQAVGPLDDAARAATERAVQRELDRLFGRERIDLVHMHGIDFHRYRIPPDVPVLVTLHLPPSWYPDSIWRLPEQFQLLCVSQSQLCACPSEAHARLRVVPNGVPLPPERPRPGRHGFALMLSRICPEKNLHAGLDAARLAGVGCVLGAEVFPYEAHLRYLHEEIEPRLQRSGVCWPGALTGNRKLRFLHAARCVLLPTLAPETSSMVALEALAAGTSVIAYPSGALPELVQHGRTGFLVDSVEEMADAIRHVDELDPAACRRAAEAYSVEAMVRRYVEQYQALLAREAAGVGA